MTKRILLAACLLLLTFALPTAQAGTYADPVSGFTIEIPDDWKEIPPAEVTRLMGSALSPSATASVHFLKAFEPASHTRNFQYPYLVFFEINYPAGQTLRSVSEADLKRVVSAVNGMTADDIKKVVTPTVSSALGPMSVRTASYFTSPPGYVVDLEQQALGKSFHGHCIGLLGRDHCVQACLYYLPADAASMQPTITTLGTTFHMDASQEVTYRQFNPAFLAVAGIMALFILASIIIMLVVFIRWLSKPKSTPRPS